MKKSFLILSIFCLSMVSAFSLPSLIEQQTFKASNITKIDLNLSWEDVEIQESDKAGNISIEIYCNKAKWAPEINTYGSTLIVKSVKTNFNLLLGQNPKGTVIVRLPSGSEFEQFSMSTTSGDIHTQTAITAQKFSSDSTSGEQSITNEVFAKDIILESTSGTIVTDSIIGERLKASATSGSIKIAGFDGSTCSADTTSGSIKISNLKVDLIKANSTSGSITIEGTIFQAFDSTSTSGMINFELGQAPSSNSRAKATSGSIFVGLPGDSNFSLNVQTTSGAFVNALTKEKIGDHVNYNRDINKGGATIILSSTSGRITVDSTNGIIGNVFDSSVDPDVPVVSFDDPIF